MSLIAGQIRHSVDSPVFASVIIASTVFLSVSDGRCPVKTLRVVIELLEIGNLKERNFKKCLAVKDITTLIII